jgi:hypothetical protein
MFIINSIVFKKKKVNSIKFIKYMKIIIAFIGQTPPAYDSFEIIMISNDVMINREGENQFNIAKV